MSIETSETMNIDIIEDKENRLLNRREIKFRVNHDGPTPSREDARKELVSFLKTKPELLIIERMNSEFGKRETLGYAKLYETEERVKEVEHQHIFLRNFPSAESKEEVKQGGE